MKAPLRTPLVVACAAWLLAPALMLAGAAAELPARRIADVALNDLDGAHHRLFRFKADKGLVLYSQRLGCPIVNVNMPKLRALRDRFAARGIRVLLYNSAGDPPADLQAWTREFGVDLPVLRDVDQLLLDELGVERSGVATVIDTSTRKIVYQGAIDDQSHYESQKPEATKHYLADALDAVLAGRPVAVPMADSLGCLITRLEPALPLAASHYSTRVAPVIRAKCVACHRPQGAGPFAFTGYDAVRRWSAMAKETILAGRMAPHDADPEIGQFAFSGALTGAEKRDLVSWFDAGAPRGDGPDALEVPLPAAPEWPDGPPDVVLEVPAYPVPATGVIDYLYPTLPTGLAKDTWIRRVVIKPSSEAVTHHVLAFTAPVDQGRPSALTADDWVGVYSPGIDLSAHGMADSSGGSAALLLEAGTTLHLQVHYTTIGKPVSNTVRVGLYFHRGTPTLRIRTMGIPSDLSIPPGVPDHPAAASTTLKEDVILYGLYPHMHYRGSRAKFEIEAPGQAGREALLSVPRYRFNWQSIYYLAQPRTLSKGTTVHFTGGFDNSADNPLNPDPTRRVPFGNQSWDEMFIGYLVYGIPVR